MKQEGKGVGFAGRAQVSGVPDRAAGGAGVGVSGK